MNKLLKKAPREEVNPSKLTRGEFPRRRSRNSSVTRVKDITTQE